MLLALLCLGCVAAYSTCTNHRPTRYPVPGPAPRSWYRHRDRHRGTGHGRYSRFVLRSGSGAPSARERFLRVLLKYVATCIQSLVYIGMNARVWTHSLTLPHQDQASAMLACAHWSAWGGISRHGGLDTLSGQRAPSPRQYTSRALMKALAAVSSHSACPSLACWKTSPDRTFANSVSLERITPTASPPRTTHVTNPGTSNIHCVGS